MAVLIKVKKEPTEGGSPRLSEPKGFRCCVTCALKIHVLHMSVAQSHPFFKKFQSLDHFRLGHIVASFTHHHNA